MYIKILSHCISVLCPLPFTPENVQGRVEFYWVTEKFSTVTGDLKWVALCVAESRVIMSCNGGIHADWCMGGLGKSIIQLVTRHHPEGINSERESRVGKTG